MPSNNRKWKSMLHKIEYLRLELEDCEEKIKEWESALSKEISNIVDPPLDVKKNEEEHLIVRGEDNEVDPRVENSNIDDKTGESVAIEEVIDEKSNEKTSKLWRAIAAKTHPDKTGNDDEMTSLYKRANEARKLGDYSTLLEIAIELKLPIDEPDEDVIKTMEEKAVALEKKIESIKNSVLWAWGYADEKKRSMIRDVVVQNRRARRAAEAQARRSG